jgi:hypothetical protein
MHMRLGQLARLAVICVAVAPLLATSCTAFGAMALAPSPAVNTDSIARASFSIVARIAAHHGLTTTELPPDSARGWPRCFTRDSFFFCGKLKGGEVQWRYYQAMTPRFTRWADSVRNEVRDSLRLQISAGGVRDCKWHLERDDAKSGCPPLQPANDN